MRKPRNRFDVQVVFPDRAFGIKNRVDVELTPEQVADELEKFCACIRNGGKVQPPVVLPFDARPEMDQLISERAQRLGVSRAQFVRQVLEQFLDVPSPGRAWEIDADHEQEIR